MKLGIKVGIKNDSIADLDATGASACEVWYNAAHSDEYIQLFEKLSTRGIDVGLHYWGALLDGTMTNIAYPDKTLNEASVLMILHTIETAARYGFKYVNIHPTNRAIIKVDFTKMDYPYVSKPCTLEVARENFLNHAKILAAYAHKLGVIFTVETVCPRSPKTDWYNEESRMNPIDIYDLPVSVNLAAIKAGIAAANDFGHTAANCPSDSAGTVWDYLLATTKTMAPATRLIHLSFLVPPFNGCDFHDMLDNPLLDTTAVPNNKHMVELFKLFQNRDDIWVITEPRQDHVKNYFLAQKILNQAVSSSLNSNTLSPKK